MSERIRYDELCATGTRLEKARAKGLREVISLGRRTEDDDDPKLAVRLTASKAAHKEAAAELSIHVSRCDGCVRTAGQTGGITSFERAPSRRKPAVDIAAITARLRRGEAIEVIAAEHQRTAHTVGSVLNQAGFSVDGKPMHKPKPTRLVPLVKADESWRLRALCAETDAEAFFPEKGGTTRPAKAVCAECPVRTECLRTALDNDERFGLWGGLSERERRRLKRGAA